MNSSTPRESKKGSLATLLSLLPFLKPYKRQFLFAGIALLVAAGATLTIPLAFRRIIDFGFGVAGSGSTAHIDLYFLGLFAVACLLAIGTAARYYMVSWLGERVTADLRSAVYAHVVLQSPQFFETTKTGEILSRLTTDTTLIQTLVGTSISLALRNILLFAGGLAMLFITSPRLSSIILVTLVAVVVPIIFFGRRVRKLSRDSHQPQTIRPVGIHLHVDQRFVDGHHLRKIFAQQRFVKKHLQSAACRDHAHLAVQANHAVRQDAVEMFFVDRISRRQIGPGQRYRHAPANLQRMRGGGHDASHIARRHFHLAHKLIIGAFERLLGANEADAHRRQVVREYVRRLDVQSHTRQRGEQVR